MKPTLRILFGLMILGAGMLASGNPVSPAPIPQDAAKLSASASQIPLKPTAHPTLSSVNHTVKQPLGPFDPALGRPKTSSPGLGGATLPKGKNASSLNPADFKRKP
jgi:hypothetical protein